VQDHDNDVSILFREMLNRGLISSSNAWLEKAIDQKNPRLPISIANSRLLVYDSLDAKLLTLTWKN
jgi:hypothetical protein